MGRIADWWSDHVAHTRSYVNAAIAKDQRSAIEALGALWKGAGEWGDIIGDPVAGALMAEHTLAIKALADSASDGSISKGEQEIVQKYLKKNAAMQTALYAKRIKGFPAEKWAALFDEHVAPTFQHVVYLSQGKNQEANQALQQVAKNRDQIMAVSERIFPESSFMGLPTWAVVAGAVVGGLFLYNTFFSE